MKIGSRYYFYHNDHLGTPQKMTAVNGAMVWSTTYDSFGKADVTTQVVELVRHMHSHAKAQIALLDGVLVSPVG